MRETVFLNNDREMPLLGLGVYKLPDDVQAEAAVISAISAGYRMIDTASVYKNEESVGCAFVQMQRPVQHMNVGAILGLELLNELCDDVQQVLCGGVFVQRSQLVDGFFRAGLVAGQQVRNCAVAFRVPDLGVALVLTFNEGRVPALVELPFHIREGHRQIIRVGWSKSRTETVEAIPVDVALGSFRVDVLTVGKVETAVVVLGVISAVCSGSSVVSC